MSFFTVRSGQRIDCNREQIFSEAGVVHLQVCKQSASARASKDLTRQPDTNIGRRVQQGGAWRADSGDGWHSAGA